MIPPYSENFEIMKLDKETQEIEVFVILQCNLSIDNDGSSGLDQRTINFGPLGRDAPNSSSHSRTTLDSWNFDWL